MLACEVDVRSCTRLDCGGGNGNVGVASCAYLDCAWRIVPPLKPLYRETQDTICNGATEAYAMSHLFDSMANMPCRLKT